MKPDSELLFYYASKGDVRGVRRAVEAGADINEQTSDGDTALHTALFHEHDAVAEFLLDQGAHVNGKGNSNATPLVNAVWTRRIAFVPKLLEAGADPNVYFSGKPLIMFAWGPRPYKDWTDENTQIDRELVKLLLDGGADPNRYNDLGWCFLMGCKDAELIEYAIDKGANANAFSGDGSPILRYHVHSEEILKLLISRGADIEARDEDGYTPLMTAAYLGYETLARVLIEHGADVDATAPHSIYRDRTVNAQTLAEENNHPEIARILKKKPDGLFKRLFGG